MRDKQRICTISEVLLFLIVPAVFSTGNLYADQSSKYLDAVRTFADRVLQSGTDIYGPNTTPLFADGLIVAPEFGVLMSRDRNKEDLVKWLEGGQNDCRFFVSTKDDD